MLKQAKNQKGLTFIEIMVAAAMISVISLAVMRVMQNANKGMKKVETDAEALDFSSHIRALFKSANYCVAALGDDSSGVPQFDFTIGDKTSPVKPPSGEITTEYQTVDKITVPVGTTSKVFEVKTGTASTDMITGFPSWRLDEIRLYNQVGGGSSGVGFCDIRFALKRFGSNEASNQRSGGVPDKYVWLSVNCILEDNGSGGKRLTYCAENSTIAAGYWNPIIDGEPSKGIEYTGEVVRVNGMMEVNDHLGVPSDIRLKERIKKVKHSAEKLEQITPYRYFYKKGLNNSDEEQIGFIAQEVERVFPEAVYESIDGSLRVKYGMFIPLLLNAHKEQKKEIEELRRDIKDLKEKLDGR